MRLATKIAAEKAGDATANHTETHEPHTQTNRSQGHRIPESALTAAGAEAAIKVAPLALANTTLAHPASD